eukprot:gene11495-biopygen21406
MPHTQLGAFRPGAVGVQYGTVALQTAALRVCDGGPPHSGFGVAGGAAGAERRSPKGRMHDQTDTIGENISCFPRFSSRVRKFLSRRTRFFSRFGASSMRSRRTF